MRENRYSGVLDVLGSNEIALVDEGESLCRLVECNASARTDSEGGISVVSGRADEFNDVLLDLFVNSDISYLAL